MNPSFYSAAIFALALAFATASADAHSKTETTQPADGAVLQAAPQAIALRFETPMRITLISLTDQDGVTHDLNRSDNMKAVREFSAKPPALPAGQYKVEWRGLAADGHPMQGMFTFEIAP
ncbi:MAG: copper resistance protein CopC [Roseovarius sp.]|nr:copper resistance protein CopC [Roseovarius sp.]